MDNNDRILGIDIGGSHISAALIIPSDGGVVPDSYFKKDIDPHGTAGHIIRDWMELIHTSLSGVTGYALKSIGIAIPGPFDYENGISLMKGVNKYESLYGINIKTSMQSQLVPRKIPVYFENDAACFGMGECLAGSALGYKKVMTITLGTGLGAAFVDHNELVKYGPGVPPEGCLYNIPYKDGIAEDYISTRWLMKAFTAKSGRTVKDIKAMADLALCQNYEPAIQVFKVFGANIGIFLSGWVKAYEADCLVIGGNIVKSGSLFLPAMKEVFTTGNIPIPIKVAQNSEVSAMIGAANMANKRNACFNP